MRATSVLSILVLSALAAPASAQAIRAELVATGFEQPLYVCSPPGDTQRLFVLEREGRVRIVKNGSTLATPFLDIESFVDDFGEGGILGLAFHPDYAVNGRFFLSYTSLTFETRVVEYAVSADPDVADPTPVQTIFAMQHFGIGHFGGCLQFGPDRLLYFSTGDAGQGEVAQDGLDLRGKLFRLDVDLPPPFVPPSNPFVGDPTVNDAVWALGLRNPWRFSFDRATGDLWIADVGAGAEEELNFQPAASTGGENYGWPCFEGEFCNDSFQLCSCGDPTLVDPVLTYNHFDSSDYHCVIGGYVYRGTALPSLAGRYVHGDFTSSSIWSFVLAGGTVAQYATHTTDLEPDGALTIERINSFGEDASGELYIADPGNFGATEGEIWKIVPGPCPVESYCVTSPNSVGPGALVGSFGSTSLAQNEFTLTVAGAVPVEFGIFYYGGATDQAPFGDGVRCVASGGAGLLRLGPPAVSDGTGTAERFLDFSVPPAGSGPGQIDAGSTWYFQYWYRDPQGPGGTGFNLSDALDATFCP